MRGFLQRLVERLHDGERPLSRNRHFHVFAGPSKAALRIDRHLRDLETQLAAMQARGERPHVRRLADGGAQLVLTDRKMAVVRTATLPASDVALLMRDPIGVWAFGEEQAVEIAPASSASGRQK